MEKNKDTTNTEVRICGHDQGVMSCIGYRSLVRRAISSNFVRSLNFQWSEHECVFYVGGSPVEFF